jgi:hypothetical protein
VTRTGVTAAVFLSSLVAACGASMRPIPDDVQPVPSAPLEVSALADAGGAAAADAAPLFAQAARAPKAPVCADSHGRPVAVKRVAADRWIVGGSVIDVLRGERKAIVTPRLDASGAVVGWTLRDVGVSCLAALGFQNGDLVRSVDSYALAPDGSTIDPIRHAIGKSGEAVVRFDRAGRAMTVVYEVRAE